MRIGGLVGLTVGNLEAVENNRLYKVTVYENEPEEYITFTTSEAKEKGIDPYLAMRERYGEVILPSSPLIREQFDKRDPFAAAHPRHVHVITIAKKITELAEAAGLRTRVERRNGMSNRKEVPNCNGFRRYHSTMLVNSSLTTELRWLLEGQLITLGVDVIISYVGRKYHHLGMHARIYVCPHDISNASEHVGWSSSRIDTRWRNNLMGLL